MIIKKQEHRTINGQRDIYFLEVLFITLIAGAIIHAGLIGFFFWLEVPEMGYYNIFSVLLFSIGFIVLRTNHRFSNLYFVVGSLEVIFHAVISTYYVGSDAGFSLFLWAIPPVLILHPKISDWLVIVGCIVVATLYVLLNEVLFSPTGIYLMDAPAITYSYYACFFGAVSITMAIIFYYRKIVSRKEKIILREIHHRIMNNLQMVSSIASIRNNEFSERKTNSAVDELKTDVWYLSAMHSQILVTGMGTLINFSRFMDVVMLNSRPLDHVLKVNSKKDELFLNLETGIPLGLIASQVIEFFNAIQLETRNVKTQFNVLNDTPTEGEIHIQLTSDDILDMSKIHMEESSAEIISLLLEQLEGSHELIREPNSVQFLIHYRVI